MHGEDEQLLSLLVVSVNSQKTAGNRKEFEGGLKSTMLPAELVAHSHLRPYVRRSARQPADRPADLGGHNGVKCKMQMS